VGIDVAAEVAATIGEARNGQGHQGLGVVARVRGNHGCRPAARWNLVATTAAAGKQPAMGWHGHLPPGGPFCEQQQL